MYKGSKSSELKRTHGIEIIAKSTEIIVIAISNLGLLSLGNVVTLLVKILFSESISTYSSPDVAKPFILNEKYILEILSRVFILDTAYSLSLSSKSGPYSYLFESIKSNEISIISF